MPTKPTVVFTIATNVTYAGGPFAGSLTKVAPPTADGYVPGVIIDAEHHNFVSNAAAQWITDWLFLGTSAADEDAHLMETDSSGFNNTARMNLGGTAASSFALTVNENSGATGAAGEFINGAGGFGITASATGVLASIKGTCTGVGPGIQGTNVSGGGVGGDFSGNGAASGVTSVGGATGQGGTFTGGATSGHGVQGTCVGAQAGVRGISSSSAAVSQGVLGTATRNDGAGVHGLQLIAGADPANGDQAGVAGLSLDSSGVFGLSTNGRGVTGISVAGYGVVAESDTTGPTRAPFRLVPQDADPGTFLNGDVTYNSAEDALKVVENATWRIVHATPNGFVEEHSSPSSSSKNGVSFSVFTSVNVTPKKVGSVMVHVTGSFRNTSSNLNSVEVQLWDSLAGTQIGITEIFLAQTNAIIVAGPRPNAYERTISFRSPYVLPNTTTRAIQVRIATHGTATGVEWAGLVLNVEGVF